MYITFRLKIEKSTQTKISYDLWQLAARGTSRQHNLYFEQEQLQFTEQQYSHRYMQHNQLVCIGALLFANVYLAATRCVHAKTQ